MTWEEFLVVIAYRCQLKGAAQEFFIQVFTNENYIKKPEEDLAEECSLKLKTCKSYFTKIFSTVGKDVAFQRTNRKREELYERLQKEFQQREFSRKNQAEARSKIPCSIHEQLHLAIRNFNYTPQKIAFGNALGGNDAAQALLVRVDNLALQKWLVWRLVQQFYEIDGFEKEKPFRLTVRATRHWGAQPEEVWRWLAEGIACDDASPEQVLNAIANTCQLRSVVIAIYEVSQIKATVWDCLLQEFWQPLVKRLNASPCGISQRRCLLFLTGHADYGCPRTVPVLTELSAWKTVQEQDWKLWLRNRQIQEFLTQATKEQDWASTFLDKPEVLIKTLGQEVGLIDGIEEMVHHWNLGDA